MKYRYAWVTLTAKVYVPEDEVGEHMTVEDEKSAFLELATERINELFKTDDPLKLEDVSIDLNTYK
jgi:hypothetical protein